MAVSTTNAYSGPFITNGVTTVFPFTFTAPSVAEVAVFLRDADGVETEAEGYTVALTTGGGGSVTFATAPASGWSLYILLDPDFTQNLTFEDGSAWLASPVNEGYDRSAARDQFLKREGDRGFKVPVGEAGLRLPGAGVRAGYFLAFDASGQPAMASGTGADAALRLDLASAVGPALILATALGAGAIAETLADRLSVMDVYASSYGFSPLATPAQNLASLKLAVAATPTYGRLIIGEGTFTVDVTGGLSAAVLLDRTMTIEVRGRIEGDGFTVQANPTYLFRVTAPGVVFTGYGTIAGDGTANADNSGTIATHPGLIYVEGDDFVLDRTLTIDGPPKVGIVLTNCWRATIGGKWKSSFAQGLSDGTTTAYFGIIANGGGKHIFDGIISQIGDDIAAGTGSITGTTLTVSATTSGAWTVNTMIAGPNIRPGTIITADLGGGQYTVNKSQTAASAAIYSGRIFVNFIFTSGVSGNANECTVRNCRVDAFEKLLYGYGNDHHVHDNKGTAAFTEFIRLIGSRNKAHDNECYAGTGVVSVYNGTDNEVRANIGRNLTQVGVLVRVFPGSGYAGGFNRTVISDNVLTADPTSTTIADGVLVDLDGVNTSGVTVSRNTITSFAVSATSAAVHAKIASPFTLSKVLIEGNVITSAAVDGISTDRVIDSVIQGNTGTGITGAFLKEAGATRNRWLDNTGKTITTKGVSGIVSTSEARGNKFTDGNISGVVTLVAGTATFNTVEVLTGDRIELFRQAAGGALGDLSVGPITAGVGAVINSSSATDASTVFCRIVH